MRPLDLDATQEPKVRQILEQGHARMLGSTRPSRIADSRALQSRREAPLSTHWTEVSRSELRKTIEDHALVVTALGISSSIGTADGQHVLLVPASDSDRAATELFKYVRENRPGEAADEPHRPLERSVGAAVVYALLLVALDFVQRIEAFGLPWRNAGIADAALIRAGAWWRAVTALTLHADAVHLAGNLVFGAAFGIMLAQTIGIGMAWLTFLIAGAAGNWLNAWFQGPAHASLGASTAIFGVLGAQAAHDWVRRRQLSYDLVRRWAPLAAGAALLAWLGGDGRAIDAELRRMPVGLDTVVPKIDVGAHVLGFAIGIVAGATLGWAPARLRRMERAQGALAASVVGLFVLAWWLALR